MRAINDDRHQPESALVQQKDYASSIQHKLDRFDKEHSSQRISIKQNLDLSMLPEELKVPFSDEAGRVYGLTSSYVHLTPQQIQERIAAVDAGRTAGKESVADVEALNLLVARGLAISLTLLFHSVPQYVADDWMVDTKGKTDSRRFRKCGAWPFAFNRRNCSRQIISGRRALEFMARDGPRLCRGQNGYYKPCVPSLYRNQEPIDIIYRTAK